MFGIDNVIDLKLKNEKVLKFKLVKNAITNDARNVLEIGCGGGTVVRTLAQCFPGVSFIGYDNDKTAIEYANRHKLHNLRFVDSLDGFPDDYFDHIILVDCLEHVDEPLLLMKRINNMLRKGGTTIIHIPLEKQGIYANVYCRNIKSIYSQHVVFYGLNDLLTMLEKAGFVVKGKSFHYHLISGMRDFLKYYFLYKKNMGADEVSKFYSKNWSHVLESKPLKLLMSIMDTLAYYESSTLKNVNSFSSGVTLTGVKR